eukprot:TRINITY_DN743_c1_g4_i1.p1 TRINITY_DN743_c1_g4~~TRINITY_DN743_c1_g4_i1.p1  ORF type:complete len:1335 (-),score=475.41 TRINITY_DN743_c1_g4_i1:5534-9538(-)
MPTLTTDKPTIGSRASAQLPVDSLTQPQTLTMRPPPMRLETALIPARPAAADPVASQPVAMAQNGPLKQQAPMSTSVSNNTTSASEWNRLASTRPPPMSISGMAVCQRRSPLRSEWRPHQTISTEATRQGIELTRPVCITDRPKDFSNCGCHTFNTEPAAEAQEQTSAMPHTCGMLKSFHKGICTLAARLAASLSMVAVSHARWRASSHFACAGRSVRKRRQTRPNSTVGTPSSMNSQCQPRRPPMPSICSSSADTGEATKLAAGMATMNNATMRARQADGIQQLRYNTTPGKKPASAAPRMKRTKYSELGPCTSAVLDEIKPQVIMMRASHLRAPNFCSARLLGTSKMKQAMKNRLLAKPNILGDSPMSWFICSAAMPMLPRSMKANRQHSMRKGNRRQVTRRTVSRSSCLSSMMVSMGLSRKEGAPPCPGGWPRGDYGSGRHGLCSVWGGCFQHRQHIAGSPRPHGDIGILGDPADVRAEDDVGDILQGMRRGEGFLLEAVQAGRAQLARGQRSDQGLLVDEAAARGIDQDGAILHARQRGGIDHVAVLGGQRAMQREHVGAGEERLQVGQLHAGRGFLGKRIVRQHLHAQRHRRSRHAATDGAKADQAEGAALQLQALVGGLVPVALAHARIQAHHVLGAGHHQRPGVLGHGRGIGTGRRLHGDAALLGGLAVDGVDAGAVLGDHAQGRAGLHDARAHAAVAHDDAHRLVLLRQAHQVILGRLGAGVDQLVVMQDGHRRRRQVHAGDDHHTLLAGATHSDSPSASTPPLRNAPSSQDGRNGPPVRISVRRLVSSATFLAAAASREAAFSRSTTTTPSASPTIRSPGCTLVPPTDTGQFTRPAMFLVGPLGLAPMAQTGKPISRSASVSRTDPQMMMPARPLALHWDTMISPISAQVSSPLPSMTRTSPGLAMAMAAWIIRLSPGRTSTVMAGPATRIDGDSGAMRLHRVPRRPATSARMEAANSEAWATMPASTRSMSRMKSGWVLMMILCFDWKLAICDAACAEAQAWEYMGRPATGTSARRMDPVWDSVMKRLLPSGPPKARLVVEMPALERIRNSGSANFESRQMEPKPVWAMQRQLCASSARPSGPAMPPCRLANTPTLPTTPLWCSGMRQICWARVTATSRWFSAGSQTMPLGLGMVLIRQLSWPSGESLQTRPVASCRPVWPWSVKQISPCGPNTRSLTPLKPSEPTVSSSGDTAPVSGSSCTRPRLQSVMTMRPLLSIFRPLGQPSYSVTSSHWPSGEMRKMRPYGMSVTYRRPWRSKDGPSRKESIGRPPRLASPQAFFLGLRKCSGRRVKTVVSTTGGGAKKLMLFPWRWSCPRAPDRPAPA